MRHLIKLEEYSEDEILEFINLASEIKKDPKKFENKLNGKTLLMLFAKPSLRTHLSFDVAMYKLGGHSIFYDLSNSSIGEKESIKDAVIVMSRYVDIIMARLYDHKNMAELVRYSNVPIINGLDNLFHPCQVLGDLLTIKEKLGRLKKLKVVYLGDANNNVTHSLMYGCSLLGINLTISCPNKKEFRPNKTILDLSLKFAKGSKSKLEIEKDPKKAVKNADVLYTDTWMSYHIPKSDEKRRVRILKKYQIDKKLFGISKKAIFMHCLPARRGDEVTDDVMDSERSVIYDQAENRLWIQMAILLKLLEK